MASGKVKLFKDVQGYGFIIPDGGGDDVFCHCKDLKQTGIAKLQAEQRVTFDIAPGRDGKTKAVNVHLA